MSEHVLVWEFHVRADHIAAFAAGSACSPDLKRNLRSEDKKHFERFLGLPESEWGISVTKPSDVPKLIGVLRRQLATLGYPPRELTSPAVSEEHEEQRPLPPHLRIQA